MDGWTDGRTDGRTIKGFGDGEGNQRRKREKKRKFGENITFDSTSGKMSNSLALILRRAARKASSSFSVSPSKMALILRSFCGAEEARNIEGRCKVIIETRKTQKMAS